MSPTSTPATTAATWRRPTSTPSPSSRSSPTPTRRSTAAPSAPRSRWSPRADTQEFHGSGYWYGRRSDWNANSWTNKRNEAPAPLGGGKLIEKSESSRNDYGYTLGGPIYIPGKFNVDKKKLFFFWSQEFQRRKDPVGTQNVRVPTALERQGDFSQSLDNNGNLYPYIKDYTTGLPCSASDTRGCFSDGGVLGKIPQNRLYQPGLAALNVYPLPNTTQGSGINYTSQTPGSAPRGEQLLRLDFAATDNWHFTTRYLRNTHEEVQPYGTTWAGAGGTVDTINTLRHLPGENIMVSAQGILNSTTSLELSVGRAHNELKYSIQNTDLRRKEAGLSSFPALYSDAIQEDYIPDFNFTGGRTNAAARIQTDRGPFQNENTTYDIVANLTKVMGKHSAKAGVYFQHSYKPQSPFASFNSQINFTDNSSNPYDTNYGYANAATGVFNTYTQASTYAMPEWVYKNIEWYVQDNWKATSRLTLDYGVRFYYMTPQWDQTLAASTFLPNAFDAANAARLYKPVCVGGNYPCSGDNLRAMDPALIGSQTPTVGNTVVSRFAGRLVPGSNRFNGAFQAGQNINDTMQSGNAFKVSPRFGFVFDASGNGTTIVRGGGGIFYDRPQGNMVFDQIANAPGMLQPRVDWGLLQGLGGSASSSDPYPTLTLNPTAYDFEPPVTYGWNVGVQQKVWKSLTFDIAYVGSINKNLLEQDQINSVPLGAAYLAQNQNPTLAANSKPGANAYATDLMRPYQGYGTIRLWGYTGESNYHSLQTSLNKRFDNGFMFSTFYVWSKALTTSNDDFTARRPNSTDAENKRVNYSYANYDRPHNFVVNLVYQTPKVASGVLGVLANDWQISGIYRYMSGLPYAVNFSVPGYGSVNFTGSPDIGARIVVTGDPGKGSTSDPYRMLNTSAFAPPTTGSDGTESARFFMHAPPINNLDLSLSKAFPVGKRVKLEVRLDAFNALNHTQFSGVNATANFASLTDHTITNLPFNAAGELVRNNGFGTVNGAYQPRTLQLVTRLTF